MDPPAHEGVDIVAKKDNPSLAGMNNKIIAMVRKNFYHDVKEGWKKRVV